MTRPQPDADASDGALERERLGRIESEAAEERLAFLYQATGSLFSAPLLKMQRLQMLTQIAVPSLADWCLAELVDHEGQRERVAANHWNPRRRVQASALCGPVGPVDPEALNGFSAVLRSGEPVFAREVPRKAAAPRDEVAGLVHDLAIRSYLIVPLTAGGRTIGAVMFAFAESARLYDEADLALCEDLGQRAAMAIQNALLFEEAEAAIRARDELVSIASHDVRTPLSALLLRAAVLRRKVDAGAVPTTEIRVGLEAIERQVRRAVDLLDNLLSTSRLASGRLDLALEALDLERLVRDVLARHEDLLAAADCSTTVHVRGGGFLGRWDRLRMEQVVGNLLSNAMKYGRGKPIRVELERRGDHVCLRVIDHGIGIAPAAQGRIFERFSRAAAPEEPAGHGLGLWIVRRIVTDLHGDVAVNSRPGEGATFTVTLPIHPQPQAESPAAAPI